MNIATRIVASSFGAFAAIGAIEHGIFEIMQGDVAPAAVMISSMGPPCVPEEIWNACEPAMTILPNFLLTGIAAVVLGVIFLLLIPFSHWWMKRFKYGPAEWLWRSMTYLKLQPMPRSQ